MSNLYHITAKIHELLPQVIAKYGLMEFEIESDYWYHTPKKSDFKNRIFHYSEIPNHFYNFETKHLKDYFIPAIQHLQIRQILFNLQGVLGENKESVKKLKQIYSTKYNHKSIEFFEIIQEAKSINSLVDTLEDFNYHEERKLIDELLPKSQAEALCQKWLGGLKPLFNRESKTVLQELVEILENLLK